MQRAVSIVILLCFLVTGQIGAYPVYAQELTLPAPGVMVHLSPEFNPPILKGIKVQADNPFRFEFILDAGDSKNVGNGRDRSLREESTHLIKYFLASLTTPEKDLWVNLSPYEKDRIVPDSFGQTEMGRDLLAQDYMLKQITASLIYPEDEVGKKFWKRIYEEAAKRYGTTNIPVNTFNKVWIVPEKAVVYENSKAGTAYVVEARLKVMLEQDYLSMTKHDSPPPVGGARGGGYVNKSPLLNPPHKGEEINLLGSQIVREIVIPELTKEINEGKNFAQLRQVYNSLILATWYKKKIKDSLLSQVYEDKNKVAGVGYSTSVVPERFSREPRGLANPGSPTKTFGDDKEAIYQQYLQAFKKGVYNYIKEEPDPVTQQTIPRKYFSGGWTALPLDHAMTIVTNIAGPLPDAAMKVDVDLKSADFSMFSDGNKIIAGLLNTTTYTGDSDDIHTVELMDNLEIQPGQRILSVGPGSTFDHLIYAYSKNLKIDVVQPETYLNQPYLKKFENGLERLRKSGHKILIENIFSVPIQDAKIPSSTYDYISLLNVIDGVDSLTEQELIAKNVLRVLSDGGIIFVSAFSKVDQVINLLQRLNQGSIEELKRNHYVVALRVHKAMQPINSIQGDQAMAVIILDKNADLPSIEKGLEQLEKRPDRRRSKASVMLRIIQSKTNITDLKWDDFKSVGIPKDDLAKFFVLPGSQSAKDLTRREWIKKSLLTAGGVGLLATGVEIWRRSHSTLNSGISQNQTNQSAVVISIRWHPSPFTRRQLKNVLLDASLMEALSHNDSLRIFQAEQIKNMLSAEKEGLESYRLVIKAVEKQIEQHPEITAIGLEGKTFEGVKYRDLSEINDLQESINRIRASLTMIFEGDKSVDLEKAIDYVTLEILTYHQYLAVKNKKFAGMPYVGLEDKTLMEQQIRNLNEGSQINASLKSMVAQGILPKDDFEFLQRLSDVPEFEKSAMQRINDIKGRMGARYEVFFNSYVSNHDENFELVDKRTNVMANIIQKYGKNMIVAVGKAHYQKIVNTLRITKGLSVEEVSADKAMNADEKTGGIDLSSDKALEVKNDGERIKFHLDSAQLAQLQNAPGFYPVIISIVPMVNLRMFLGL
ncbi:MAG: hypothetical protein HQL15_03115 [Candidatus Omnitrophica bacterium]|nr:hypothetical protein [Candidatus Omnitrophota bacterium]